MSNIISDIDKFMKTKKVAVWYICVCICVCVVCYWVVRSDQKITFELLLSIKESAVEKSGCQSIPRVRKNSPKGY